MKYNLLILFLGLPFFINGQVLLAESLDTLLLSDSIQVVVSNTDKCKQCFYYLPINLRTSVNKEGVPEISFTTWKNDDESEVIGGILHFLIVWGLEFAQEEELQNLLREVDSTNVLMGPVTVETLDDYVIIEGEDKLVAYLNNSARKTRIATTPGAKMAMSFSFEADEIEEVLKVIDNSDRIDARLSLDFTFDTNSNFSLLKNKYSLLLPIQNIINHIKVK